MKLNARSLFVFFGAILGALVGLAFWRRNKGYALQKCAAAAYSVAPGADIADAAAEACELASEGGYHVLFIFNGVAVRVAPGMDVRAAVNCYHIALVHAEEKASEARAAARAAAPDPAPIDPTPAAPAA